MATSAAHHGFSSGLAADQRVGMAFEIVGQHAQRARGAGDLLQGVAQLLLGRGVLADEGRVRVLEHPVGGGDRAAQFLEGV